MSTKTTTTEEKQQEQQEQQQQDAQEETRPVTERANALTAEMDVVPPAAFVGLLAASDAQIFDGYAPLRAAALTQPAFCAALARAATAVARALARAAHSRGRCAVRVVMAGAGTSGRLAWCAAREANAALAHARRAPVCRYLIAGDDVALLTSQESAEDDVARARRDLQRVLDEAATESGADDGCVGGDGLDGLDEMREKTSVTSSTSTSTETETETETETGTETATEKTEKEEEKEKEEKGARRKEVLLVYVGITCGLSAPYVAAQLDMALRVPGATTVLLGFNPPAFARTAAIEGWPGHTFAGVVRDLAAAAAAGVSAHVLCPVYGPESLAGSTRMKGGSTTKIVLDSLLSLAVAAASEAAAEATEKAGTEPVVTEEAAARAVGGARCALDAVYGTARAREGVAAAVGACGAGLCAGGHVYYVGGARLGLLGVIDASECVPTFGARADDVRAFVEGGWAALRNREGDLAARGGAYDLALAAFCAPGGPAAAADAARDTVVVLGDGCDDASRLAALVAAHTPAGFAAKRCHVVAFCRGSTAAASESEKEKEEEEEKEEQRQLEEQCRGVCAQCFVVHVRDVDGDGDKGKSEEVLLPQRWVQLAAKLVLNAVSTGAFVAAGKVYRNRMVDLRISNAKLYARACALVAALARVPPEVAEACVLRAVYTDAICSSPEAYAALLRAPVSEHVRAAYQQDKVVPAALLLAAGVPSLACARAALRDVPVVRTAIVRALAQHSSSQSANSCSGGVGGDDGDDDDDVQN